MPSKVERGLCAIQNCPNKRTTRGLCASCRREATQLVKAGKTTWEQLEEFGLAVDNVKKGGLFRKAFKKMMAGGDKEEL